MKLNSLRWVLIYSLFGVLSCASRGMYLSEQIPEFHESFEDEKKMIFAQGEDLDKIVYDNSSNEEQRSLTHEKEFLPQLSQSQVSKQKRGLASESHLESENYLDISSFEDPRSMNPPYPKNLVNIFFSADASVLRGLASITEVYKSKDGDTVESILNKNCISASCWKKFIQNNPKIFKLKIGDSINLTREVRP